MKLLFIIVAFILNSIGWAEGLTTLYALESKEDIAIRNLREGEELAYKVIEVRWNEAKCVVSFATRKDTDNSVTKIDSIDLTEIIGRVYIADSAGFYKEYLIDTIREEGGRPTVEAVGFLNADADPENELIIITSWEQKHYDVAGILYDVSVYDNVLSKSVNRLTYKRNISEQFAPECECRWSDGRRGKAKFKTLADVEKELKRLKFRQFYRSNYE